MARTIKSGGKVGSKYFYVYETGEVTSSSDPNIKVGSNVYDDGIRKDPRPAKVIDQLILTRIEIEFVS